MKLVLCLACAMATLAGCGLESRAIRIAIIVDKTIVAMNDSVSVSLAVSNASDRTVTTHAQSAYGPCLPGFEVEDEGARQVAMQVVCPLVLPATVTLEPGESFQVNTWWHPAISRVGGAAISIGIYSLRGAVRSDDDMVYTGAFDILVTDPE